jgi:hypothetical protein
MLHSIEAVEPELRRLDISQSTLCALTGITAGSLSDITRGVKKPSFEQQRDIYYWLEGLNRLIEAAKPLQLDFKKTLQLRQQIELLDAGKLHIAIFVEHTPEKQRGYWLLLRNGHFFGYRDKKTGELMSYLNLTGNVPVFSEEAATHLVSALEKSGYSGTTVKEHKHCNQDQILDFIDSVWFEDRTSKI